MRSVRDHVPYDIWRGKKLLQVTEGNVVDYGAIEEFIAQLGERFQIAEIAFDPWNSAYLIQRLEAEYGFTMIQIAQRVSTMSAPTKEFEKLVLEKKLPMMETRFYAGILTI